MILLKDRRTGLYKLRLLRDDYDVEDLRVFTPSNSRIVSLQRPSPADIVNELQVTYTDYKTFKEATIPVRDAAAVQAMGRIVSKSHSLTGLPTESLAVRCGDRDLAAMTQPLWRIDMAFLRDADDLEPGEPFVLDYPASEIFPDGLYVVLRVADEINYGNAANGSITAKCVQDVFSLPLVGSTGSLPDIDDGSPGDPVAATALVFEATYRDLAGTLTASDLAALPVDAGYIAGVAVRPNDDHRGFTLATRIDPAAYADAAEGLFSPSCTLSADIAPGQTVLPVTGWTDMAGLDVGEPLIIGSDENAEWVRVDAIAGDGSTITVGRGCVDTVPKPWPSGTRLWAYDAFAAADTTQYIDGETVDAKVLPRTSSARLPLADAALIQTTMAHRAARPLPPGGLLLNDAPFYDVGGPVIPSPPGGGGGGTTTPSTPPPLTPDGTPADTTTGPNGGYADDAPYPIPPPTTLGTDVLPGGDFGDPADLGQWRNRDGSALGAGWSLVDGKLTHLGGGVAAAYCYGARLSLPISPIPRYTVSVEMDVQCDPSVVTRVGIAWGVSTNGGAPNYVEASEAATYPAEVTVSHEWTRVVERISMLGAGTIPVVTFMPYVEHTGVLGGSLATVDNAHLVITEVPTPSTPETPDHIDFDAGLTGWTLWPDPTSASPYAPTMAVSGGELSMTVTSEYFTYRWVICDDPLVGADAIGKYIGAMFAAWCNDDSTITDATGTYTFGGAAFGVATKLPGQDYVPFTGSLPQRGDWTEREAWVRQILDETNAPGVTTHVAMLLRCSVGKMVKVRNIQPRVTDGVID
nr:phage tail protein [Thermomonas mangrovi]